MSLGIKENKNYLNIKEGKIYHNGVAYDYVEGYLKGIELRDREFKGEKVKYWYVNLSGKTGAAYSLALSYSSGVAKSLFNSLASASDYTKELKIQPYLKGDYTKIVVFSGDERLSWKHPELPKVEEVKLGDKIVKDESKRLDFIVNLVNEINSRI